MNVKLHLGTKLQSRVELRTKAETYSDSKITVHERDVELHCDSEVERPNEESIEEPRLSNYVKRHHIVEQIIGDKDARPMTSNRLRSDTCSLSMNGPKIVKDALENVD